MKSDTHTHTRAQAHTRTYTHIHMHITRTTTSSWRMLTLNGPKAGRPKVYELWMGLTFRMLLPEYCTQVVNVIF